MGQQGWGGYNRGGPRAWGRLLLPLIVGIGLGALLFGGGPRFGSFFGGGYSSQPSRQLEQRSTGREQQAQQPSAGERSAEQYALERRYDSGPRGGWHHRGFGPFGFGGFGIGRLLLPLLLIGGGLWLLNRRRGPGAPGGPPSQGQAPNQPVGPAPEQPPYGPGDAPTTGPTTRL